MSAKKTTYVATPKQTIRNHKRVYRDSQGNWITASKADRMIRNACNAFLIKRGIDTTGGLY